ncbi:hypothetical protein ABN763_04330 [Spongiivirga sp. MCCC 1A20706]|uniref:hypothetical protein n=1 Tax=Spongiivirga sp. MCCC 1A20706 TaxID=3160963 RepID=UPI0039779129
MSKEKAIEILESLQYNYKQNESFDGDGGYIHKDISYNLFNSLKQKGIIPTAVSFEVFQSQIIDTLPITHPLIAKSKYLNPFWAKVLESRILDIEKSINYRYRTQLSGNYLLGSLPFGQVNGFAYNIPNNDYILILLSDGTFGFLNQISKAIAQCFPLSKEGDSIIISKDEVLAYVTETPEIINRFFDLIWNYLLHQSPFNSEQYSPKSETYFIYDNLRTALETFILGHEFGHIIRGHFDTSKYKNNERTKLVLNNLKELEADNVGLNICLDVLIDKNVGTAIGFAGADFFFTSMMLVERSLSLLKNGYVDNTLNIGETHPPFLLRRQHLRNLFRIADLNEIEESLDFSYTLEAIIEIVWDKIQPSLLKAYNEGVRPSSHW